MGGTENSTKYQVVIRDLRKRFKDFVAVDGISFSVEKGEIFGLLGPNGAGKSTTIRLLCGLLTPTSGTGIVAGFDILREPEAIKKVIGYMSQKFSLYEDLTPFENMRFYLAIYNVEPRLWDERIRWAFDTTDLWAVKDRPTSTLPVGWRQRLALVCALLHRPKILFLDEPTSGVDPATRRRFWALIREIASQGITVFLTTHYMDEAENCHRIVLINRGRIEAVGRPDEIIRSVFPDRPATLNDAFIELTRNR